jgi:hypothetical protein
MAPSKARDMGAEVARCPHMALRVISHARNNQVASLIGRLRSSTFRLSATAMSMSLTGARFSSESAPGPLYGASFVKKFGSATHVFLRQFLCSI